MADSVLAQRYAIALLDLADEADAIDVIGADLLRLTALIDASAELRSVLFNPVFTSDERMATLSAILPRLDVHSIVRNTTGLLNNKARLALFPAIARAYKGLADVRAVRVVVIVRTARPLDPALADEVRDTLAAHTGKIVVLDQRVDERLLGGIVCQVGPRVYDASLRTRLEAVRSALLNAMEPAIA